MKIIIYTGKGGVGKTSVAAATGIKLAGAGVKTLVISTDLAHSLADSYEISLGSKPTPVLANLWALELNPQAELEEHWDKIYNYLVQILKVLGVKDVFAEELTLLPGTEELFALLQVYEYYQTGEFGAVIVDCPPTAATLRLLSFFDAMGWYMEKFFKMKRKGVKFIRTFTDSIMSIPLPEDDVFDAFADIYEKMAATKEILANPEITSIRLVMNAEQMVINETQRAYTYMNLYGFNVDAVIVNKILPPDLAGAFYAGWQKRQQENLRAIEENFTPLEIFTLPLMDDELHGVDNLQRIASVLYAGSDPLECFHKIKPMELVKEDDIYCFKVFMPFLDKKKFDLHQRGMLVIITVESYKRKVLLPQLLSNKSVRKAKYSDKYLYLYF